MTIFTLCRNGNYVQTGFEKDGSAPPILSHRRRAVGTDPDHSPPNEKESLQAQLRLPPGTAITQNIYVIRQHFLPLSPDTAFVQGQTGSFGSSDDLQDSSR